MNKWLHEFLDRKVTLRSVAYVVAALAILEFIF